MKIQIIIFCILFVVNTDCISAEVIELSSRTGNTITKESRNYFGLFPEIKNYKSAQLFQINETYNFIINTTENEINLPINIQSLKALREIINNFEEVLTDIPKFSSLGPSVVGFLKIQTKYNKKLYEYTFQLKDKSEFQGYVLYADDNILVISYDKIYYYNKLNLKLIKLEDLYSITDVSFPIIDGCQVIYSENLNKIHSSSIFINSLGLNIAPPEVFKFIENNNLTQTILSDCNIEINSIYDKKFGFSFETTFQRFNLQKLTTLNYIFYGAHSISDYKYSFENYFSLGTNFEYKISNKLFTQIGYNFEIIGYTLSNLHSENFEKFVGITCHTSNLNLYYNFWKSKKYDIQLNQFFIDAFFSIQMHFYQYYNTGNDPPKNISFDTLVKINDFTNSARFSYKFGTRIRFNVSRGKFLFISSFINYHKDLGIVTNERFDLIYTRYIKFILSYGLSLGAGFNF